MWGRRRGNRPAYSRHIRIRRRPIWVKQRNNVAPEELTELSNSNPHPTNINNSKAEVFSSGLTILECGTKGDVAGLYNLSGFKILTQKL